jgi:tungstate transport system substrate-binding protein
VRRRLLICVLAWLAVPGCSEPAPDTLTLATTTSVGHSGLLDVLLPAYERERRVRVQAHLVGSGRALAMLVSGSADVVIAHAPDAEATALAAHPHWTYRKVMFNDFVLAGPRDDPARASDAIDVVDAMRRIASSGSRFISRGDESGTHERERDLWRRAGSTPGAGRLVAAGAGMGSTLRIASETEAYTLTDRATYEQHASSLALRIVFEGGPLLLNTYSAIGNPSGARGARAAAFIEWLAGGAGRELVASYRGAGTTPLFTVWPQGDPASKPSDRPSSRRP